MQENLRYRCQYRRCGKANCRTCAAGSGHGPYWYAFWREGHRLRTRYVGKELPAGIRPEQQSHPGTGTPLPDTGIERRGAAAEESRSAASLQPSPTPDIVEDGSEIANAPQPRHTQDLRIRALGRFHVERGGQAIVDWRRQTATAVLKLLLLTEGHRATREYLAHQIAPGAGAETAREALTAAVHALRRALEPELTSAAHSRYLVQEGETLSLRLGPHDWVDCIAFERMLDGCGSLADPLPQLEAAADLYGGDLLPGESAEWCLAPRHALQVRWHGLLLALAESQTQHGQHDAAIATLMRLLRADDTQEEAAYRLMALLARQGRRAEALRIYAALKRALRRELGLQPAAATDALAAALRIGDAPPRRRPARLAHAAAGMPSAPRHASPLIGRQAHLGRIRDALLATRQGRGQLLLLVGEAGIGKTRLAEEAAVIATGHGFATLRGRCGEGEHHLPYAPVVEALRSYLRGRSLSALHRDVSEVAALAALLPELGAGMTGASQGATAGDGGFERLRLWTAIRTLLTTAGENRPVLLIFEDLHWADEATLGLLAFLARRCRDARLLLLGTWREDRGEEDLPRRLMLGDQRDGSLDVLHVRGLHLEEAAALATHRLGRPLSSEQVAVLHAQCDGNPFFIQELLALLEGQPQQHADATLAAVLAGGGTLPTSVRQTLTGRLDRLSIECRSLLRAGAVIGAHFTTDLLARVTGHEAAMVEDTLDEAVAAGLLGDGTPDQGGRYAFNHALLHRALYDELMPGQRRRLHGRTALALIERSPDGGHSSPDRIAYHFARSQDHVCAAYWLEQAGNHAMGIHAHGTAHAYYTQAREHLLAAQATLPLDPEGRNALERLNIKLRHP